MKFFIDTANVEEIRRAADMGIIVGVTTNPSLIAKEGRDFVETVKEIGTVVDGPISAEVVSLNGDEMVAEAKALYEKIGNPNIVIKIPMCAEGLKAVKQLTALGIHTNVTLIFSSSQALLAAAAGATYVSPFIGRLDDIGFDGMEAKPTIEEQQGIPHHLIDILEPTEEYTVANFYDDVMKLLPQIISRGKAPIIVGGTGLYFKVLCDNYNLPRVEPNLSLRNELETFAKTQGAEKLHDELKRLDPITAEKVHPNNVVRVIRSLEIIKTLKQPLSATERKDSENAPYDFDLIGLNFADRAKLYARINKNIDFTKFF